MESKTIDLHFDVFCWPSRSEGSGSAPRYFQVPGPREENAHGFLHLPLPRQRIGCIQGASVVVWDCIEGPLNDEACGQTEQTEQTIRSPKNSC
jgi:hypothetical protein